MAGFPWFLLLLSASCTLGVVVIDDREVEKSWIQFKHEHNKVYGSLEEEAYRKAEFEKNLQEVFQHQLAFERGEYTYEIGINHFSDMSFEEWLEHRSIACTVDSHTSSSANATDITKILAELGDPPDTQDWEKAGFVSKIVKNQNIGQCGGCYAFAAVAAVESAYALKKKLKNKVPRLSVQEIIDCGQKWGCNGCMGGHPCSAYDTIKNIGGLAYEKEYPWRSKQKPGKSCQFKANKYKELVHVTGYNELNKVTNMDYNLQTLVGVKGPTTASVCVNKKFKAYKKGVFKDDNCLKECQTKDNKGINHSVLAVAYDKKNFVIRNSWGPAWGIHGNMIIERKTGDKVYGTCGLGIDQSFPLVK